MKSDTPTRERIATILHRHLNNQGTWLAHPDVTKMADEVLAAVGGGRCASLLNLWHPAADRPAHRNPILVLTATGAVHEGRWCDVLGRGGWYGVVMKRGARRVEYGNQLDAVAWMNIPSGSAFIAALPPPPAVGEGK